MFLFFTVHDKGNDTAEHFPILFQIVQNTILHLWTKYVVFTVHPSD